MNKTLVVEESVYVCLCSTYRNHDLLCVLVSDVCVLQLRILNKPHREMLGPWTASSCVLKGLTVSSKEADEMLSTGVTVEQHHLEKYLIYELLLLFDLMYFTYTCTCIIIWDRDCDNINIPEYEMGKGRDLINYL